MRLTTPQENKVPWDHEANPAFPAIEEVDAMTREQLCHFYRYLPSPANGCQSDVLEKIIMRLHDTYTDLVKPETGTINFYAYETIGKCCCGLTPEQLAKLDFS